jgi:hypothetical protein
MQEKDNSFYKDIIVYVIFIFMMMISFYLYIENEIVNI